MPGYGRLRYRLSWLVGLAALAAVVIVATHVSEEHEFAALVSHAQPWWIAVALGLQAFTYVALAQVWCSVARASHQALATVPAVRIALAKLFVDQTLPSLGISGSVLLASALDRRGFDKPVAAATVVVELASYYFAYALGLSVAVTIAAATGYAATVVVAAAFASAMIAIGVGIGAILLSRSTRVPNVRGIRRVAQWLTCADPVLTGNVGLLTRALAWQLAVIALDSTTLWVLISALGVHAPIAGVFASFMIASLARTVSIVPGGLGVFEGVAVITLNQVGVPVAASLSATLLFRGLSYWLPMIPGFIALRGLR